MVEPAVDLKDGEYRSRKFILTFFAIILLTVVTCLGIEYPAVAGLLPTFVGGLLGLVSLYFGGNITNKWVTGKTAISLNLAAQTEVGDKPPESEDEEGEA